MTPAPTLTMRFFPRAPLTPHKRAFSLALASCLYERVMLDDYAPELAAALARMAGSAPVHVTAARPRFDWPYWPAAPYHDYSGAVPGCCTWRVLLLGYSNQPRMGVEP